MINDTILDSHPHPKAKSGSAAGCNRTFENLTFARMIVLANGTNSSLYLLYVNVNVKRFLLLLNDQKKAVQYATLK